MSRFGRYISDPGPSQRMDVGKRTACEAAVSDGSGFGDRQCMNLATFIRSNYKVCGLHARRPRLTVLA